MGPPRTRKRGREGRRRLKQRRARRRLCSSPSVSVLQERAEKEEEEEEEGNPASGSRRRGRDDGQVVAVRLEGSRESLFGNFVGQAVSFPQKSRSGLPPPL